MRSFHTLLTPLLLLAACSQGPGAPGAPRDDGAAPVRTAVLLTHVEPSNLSQHRATAGTGLTANDTIRLFNASLFINDHAGVAQPYLAVERPRLNTESWQLLADGRMETRYALRADATWHDGAPLSAEDFVLSWRVARLAELGVSELPPTKYLDDVQVVDPRTVVARWSQPFPMADALGGRAWAPLPTHILQPAYDAAIAGRIDALASHPFYTRDYVGLGPYRLERWEPGAYIEGVAFDRHVLGRPRIERIRVLFTGDPNTAVANLLSGEAHLAFDYTLGFEQGALLKRQWGNAGAVIFNPDRLRYVATQFKPDVVSPREILDLRVRRAFAHLLDRGPLVDALFGADGAPAEIMLSPTVPYAAAAGNAVTKYVYDARRAEELLLAAGFSRAPDGTFLTSAGERLSPELRGATSGQEEQETAIVADTWRRAGIDVRTRLLSEVEDRDRQIRSTYPAFAGQSTGLEEETVLLKLYSPNSATAANRWAGSNRGGWANAEYDRFYEILQTDLDATVREQAVVGAVRILSEALPVYPLYFNYVIQAHLPSIQGPRPTAVGGETTFSVHEWAWR